MFLRERDNMQVFDQWNKTELDCYLIEITAKILRHKDSDGEALVTKIRDAAGQKGTGKWTANAALDHGIPLTLIGILQASRTQKSTSNLQAKRCSLAAFRRSKTTASPPLSNCIVVRAKRRQMSSRIRRHLLRTYAWCEAFSAFNNVISTFFSGTLRFEDCQLRTRLSTVATGIGGVQLGSQLRCHWCATSFTLFTNASPAALMWRGGCIIRSVFLGNIQQAFAKNKNQKCLLTDDFFMKELEKAEVG